MAFLKETDLPSLGLARCGKNVLISDKASLYNPGKISIGDNVRIDDFCILSAGEGGIELGSFIHIACYASLIGNGKIVMEDFSGLSSRVSLFSSSDDYKGMCMTNPTIPKKFLSIKEKDVVLRKHVVIGAGAIVLPGVELKEGAAVGALSLVTKNVNAFEIVTGNPAVFLKKRSEKLLEFEKQLLEEINKGIA